MTLTLYSKDFCPYCRKVKKKLDELGLDYEEEEVPGPHDERDQVEALSDQTAVPVLKDDDHVVNDSSRIIEYLEENYA